MGEVLNMSTEYRAPAVPMDSPFYAQRKSFVKRDVYAPGDFGPPADGREYRVRYDPKTGEYLRLGTQQQVRGLQGLSAISQGPGQLSEGFLSTLKSWYLPVDGFTLTTGALWVATLLVGHRLLR